jgi:Uma2 family endonuclease
MSAAPKLKLTPQEYLARERLAELKSEYYRGEVFAMAGATRAHSLITVNLTREISLQLKGGPCLVFNNDMRVKVSPTGLYTYPDVSVVCDEAKFEDEVFDTLLNPRVIVEVLSDSTGKYDRGDKFRQYRNLASLQEYVVVSQNEAVVETFVRKPDESWSLSTFAGMEAVLAFGSIAVRIPLPEIYAGVKFPIEKAPDQAT